MVAEVAAREIGSISLVEALHLTALVAQKDPARRSRFAAKWLRRWISDAKPLTLDEIHFVAGALAALGGCRHDEALLSLRAVAEAADRRPASRGVA